MGNGDKSEINNQGQGRTINNNNNCGQGKVRRSGGYYIIPNQGGRTYHNQKSYPKEFRGH